MAKYISKSSEVVYDHSFVKVHRQCYMCMYIYISSRLDYHHRVKYVKCFKLKTSLEVREGREWGGVKRLQWLKGPWEFERKKKKIVGKDIYGIYNANKCLISRFRL